MASSCARMRRFVCTTISTLGLVLASACGDATQESLENVASDVAETTEEATHGASSTLDDATTSVGDATGELSRKMTQAAHDLRELTEEGVSSVGDWVNGPALKQREKKCKEEKGIFAAVVEVGPCIDGKSIVSVDGNAQEQACEGETQGDKLENQCVHSTWLGQYYFNDGPSVPHLMQRTGGTLSDATNFIMWNSVFWEAAVNHDYCYHHGLATYGYDQGTCDGQFVDDLMALCTSNPQSDADWFDEDTCNNNAHAMYAAVRACGSANFNVMNNRVKYPKYTPMYEKLGLKEQPIDEDLRQMIDKVL